MANTFIRCDDEFTKIEEDLNMTGFGTTKVKPFGVPVEYTPPDISKELAMLERYTQKGERRKDGKRRNESYRPYL